MTELAVRTDTAPALANAPASLIAWADAASAAHRLASPLVTTDFVPAHFRPKGTSDDALNVAQNSATAAILFGAEAGLSPMQALQGIYVISGRPAMYARTMLAVTLAQGHEVWTEKLTETEAIVCARRRGGSHTERVVWTADRARKAGYTKNSKYNSDPQSMLLARAQADACRRIAPDALLGMAYSVEEAELEGEPTTTATDAPTVRRTAKRAAPPPAPEPPTEQSAEPLAADPVDPTPEPNFDFTPATEPQVTKLNIELQEMGYGDDRTEKLAYLSALVGRDLTSSKDLSKDEASRFLDARERGLELVAGDLA